MTDKEKRMAENYQKRINKYQPDYKELAKLSRKLYARDLGYRADKLTSTEFHEKFVELAKSLGKQKTIIMTVKDLEKLNKQQIYEYNRSLKRLDQSYVKRPLMKKMLRTFSSVIQKKSGVKMNTRDLGSSKDKLTKKLLASLSGDLKSRIWKVSEAMDWSSEQTKISVDNIEDWQRQTDEVNFEKDTMEALFEGILNQDDFTNFTKELKTEYERQRAAMMEAEGAV